MSTKNNRINFTSAKRISKFAQERAKQSKTKDKETSSAVSSFASRNIVIGNIVERTEGIGSEQNVVENVSFDDSEGFPKPKRIDKKVIKFDFHRRTFVSDNRIINFR